MNQMRFQMLIAAARICTGRGVLPTLPSLPTTASSLLPTFSSMFSPISRSLGAASCHGVQSLTSLGYARSSPPYFITEGGCQPFSAHTTTGGQFSIAPLFTRGFAARGLKPEFVGGKLKPYSSYRERFRVEAGGRIRCQRPGHRHKRFVKGPKRNRKLRQRMTLHDAYARTMKKLGFR